MLAAGDTVRWIIGDTESGAGAARQIHILVKPTRPELLTNLVINTEREDVSNPRRAVFASTRLEGEVIHKPQTEVQVKAEVSEEELDKSIDALVN